MKQLYLNIFLVFILIFVVTQIDFAKSDLILNSRPTPTTTPSATPTPTTAPPVRLIIPKLKIDTTIDPVSVTAENIMQVPDGWDKAGWYINAVKPGEVGTAVIVGHFDNQYGAPAIFYSLKLLEAGDNISILKEDGQTLVYNVTQKLSVSSSSSINELLIEDKNKNLILITCGGWWNQELLNYSERLVIRAVIMLR